MNKKDIVLGLLAALVLGVVLSPFASPWPDGLEKVAEDKGFLHKGEAGPAISSSIPDYVWPGVRNEKIATAFAGAAGTLVVFGIGLGIAAALGKRES